MARFRAPLLTSLFLVSVALAAVLPGSGDAQTANHIVISEVLYDPAPFGTDSEGSLEWVEVHNPTDATVTLSGWALRDNNSQDAIPTFTLGAGQFLVVAAKETSFRARYPSFTGNLVSLENSIGNGLSNAGDRVLLLDDHGNRVDAMSYGSDTTAFDPACLKVPEGQSLARLPSERDTDSAADWAATAEPNPGEGAVTPTTTPSSTSAVTATSTPTWTPTSSPSPSPTPTVSPSPTLLPTATASASPTSSPSPTPSGTQSPSPTLTATPTPTGTITSAPTATSTVTPSVSPVETATVTPSPAATGTEAATATPTPTPTAAAAPSATPTGTPTWTPTTLPRIRLNEFLPYPDQIDWNGDGIANFEDEWIELVSLEAATIDLGGWRLDDMVGGGSNPYTFPSGTLLPGGSFLLRFRSSTKVALNQDTDTVRLVAPDGIEVDAYTYAHPKRDGSYSRTIDAIGPWTDTYPPSPGSPNLPATPTPSSTPSATLAATASPTPSPVASATPTMTATDTHTHTPTRTPTPSRTPTATPTATSTPSGAFAGAVVISEIMQNPVVVEDSHGEWIELFNATDATIDLNGWTIRDLGSDRHRIGAGGPLWLSAHGYVVLGRDANPATNGGAAVTYQYAGFSLGNVDDEVILEDGTGQEIDRVAYGSAGGFPDPNGASMALISPDRDNASGSNWRASFTAWPGSAGDLGSPGAANPIPPAQIEGHVFEDLDGNGHRGYGEPGIPGVTVRLSTGATVRTDANGWYGFYSLSAGAYVITEVQPAGYTSTTPDELAVTVGPAEISWGHDFGERRQPTATPTPTPTGQPMAWPRLLLSEVFYDAPQSGTDTDFEFVELWNGDAVPVDLQGWRVRDNTADDLLPAFTLNPGEFVVIAATAAGFSANFPGFAGHLISLEGSLGGGLGNGGDRVILLAPDGTAVDAMSYGDDATVFASPCPDVPAGASLARVPTAQDTDSAADWVAQMPPNPGQPGIWSQSTPTATASPLPTASPTHTATHTGSPSPTALQTRTPTPTWTPTATSGFRPNVHLNEVLPRPARIDWDGDGPADQYDEWVEIINLGPDAAALGGWMLDDTGAGGSQPYTLPTETLLLPGDFLVLFRRQTGIVLNNDGDTVRLVAPDGMEIDGLSYAEAEPDASYSRMIDGTGDWTQAYPPSPGRSNRPAAATATAPPSPSATSTATATVSPTPTPSATTTPFPSGVYLNEILPEPDATDWNTDGVVDSQDEFVELFNASAFPVNLGGWAVADDTHAYTLPLGTMIWPRGYLTLFRSQTHRSLGNDQDAISLWRPDGSLADGFAYAVGPGPDRSYCRDADGIGAWVRGCQPTPGEANRLAPPPAPTPADDEEDDANSNSGRAASSAAAVPCTIAAARAAAAGTWVTIMGSVTLPPGVFGRRIYLADDSGGIGVYLRRGEYPPLALGDRVSVTGRTGSSYGEAEIEISSQSRIVALGDPVTPIPRRLRTGEIGEAYEGRLAWVFGRVVAASHTSVTLDDGTGPAAIYFPEGLPWRRPYVKLGDFWAAQGVIGQYAAKEPYIGGYRLIPRLATDLSQAPLFLPVTGAGLP